MRKKSLVQCQNCYHCRLATIYDPNCDDSWVFVGCELSSGRPARLLYKPDDEKAFERNGDGQIVGGRQTGLNRLYTFRECRQFDDVDKEPGPGWGPDVSRRRVLRDGQSYIRASRVGVGF